MNIDLSLVHRSMQPYTEEIFMICFSLQLQGSICYKLITLMVQPARFFQFCYLGVFQACVKNNAHRQISLAQHQMYTTYVLHVYSMYRFCIPNIKDVF